MSRSNETRIPMDVQQGRDQRKELVAVPEEALYQEKRGFTVLQRRDGEEEAMPQGQVLDMHHIRNTIIEQEAVFREQVRELHRVHRVQTLLMAEMRRKDLNFISHPSGANLGGLRQSPVPVALASGRWNSAVGPVFNAGAKFCEPSKSPLPEPLMGGLGASQRDFTTARPLQEANLFKRSPHVAPVRKTFDLEQPPEEDDDDQHQGHRDEENFRAEGNCIQFMESPASGRSDPESEISLNLSSGWSRGKAVNDTRGGSPTAMDNENLKAVKRSREEASLIPFLATKSENLRDTSPVRPTPRAASFLGGFWGLQLGRKVDNSSPLAGNSPTEDADIPKKKKRQSLDLEFDDKVPPATPPNGAPHWLLKAPAAKPTKKAVCQTENSRLNFQHSVSPPRNSCEQGMMKSCPPQSRGEPGSGPASLLVWDGERQAQAPDNFPGNRSQFSHNVRKMAEEDLPAGMRDGYQVPVATMGSSTPMASGNGPIKTGPRGGEAPRDTLTLYPSWMEVGEVPCDSFPNGLISQTPHTTAGRFQGVQVRTYDGPGPPHRAFSAQSLVQVGPPVNIGTGPTTFVADSDSGMWYQQRVLDSQFQTSHPQQQQQLAPLHGGVLPSCRGPWQPPMQIPRDAAFGQGTVYAIPATPGSSLGYPIDGFRKVNDPVPGPNWTSGGAGPTFTPISIVAPPKPPFKKPPKLVLTHDGTSMELKLVSPERHATAKVVTVEKSVSGSSDEELGRQKGSTDGPLDQGRVENESDVSLPPSGRRDRDKRAFLKEKSSPEGPRADWMVAKVWSSAAPRVVHSGRRELQHPDAIALVNGHHQEGMDEADGGSSDAGSGGSGVGDVINPGDRASPPSPGTLSAGGSSRYQPAAGEGEEGVNMGELGLEADSGSQSITFDRKPLQDNPSRKQQQQQQQHKQEVPAQEPLITTLSFGSSLSMTVSKISLGNSDGSGRVVNTLQKPLGRGAERLSQDGDVRAAGMLHRLAEQSGSPSGFVQTSSFENGNHRLQHGLFPEQPSLGQLKNVQLELQQPISSTSQPKRIHPSQSPDSGHQGKDCSKEAVAWNSSSGYGNNLSREHRGGRAAMDDIYSGIPQVDQRNNTMIANSADVCKRGRESKAGRSSSSSSNKQLSGVGMSEKDVQYKPYSPPVVREVPSSSSTVDMGTHAGGSSKKVSQASETVQGNGRSPLRYSEWIGPAASTDQYHSWSPGGIKSFCQEDGTLVKGQQQQQGKSKQKGKEFGREGTYLVSLSHKDLGRPDAAVAVTNPSSCN